MFRLQKISNYGTSTPAVARTFAQGCDVLNWFDCTSDQIEDAKGVLLELQRHLLKCVELQDGLGAEIELALKEAEELRAIQPPGTRAFVLPGVGELQGRAEAFLHAAKLAVAATGELPRPFYGKGFGHNYRSFGSWAAQQFGADDEFTRVVESWEPFVRRIGEMRNAVDHPKNAPSGRLVTKNFDTITDEAGVTALSLPAWGLLGEEPHPMLSSFRQVTENIILVGEIVLARLFYKLKKPWPVVLRDIPENERDPANPKRFEVVLAQ